MVNDREWSKAYHENLEKIGEDLGGKVFDADPDANRIGNTSWRDFVMTPTLFRDLSRIQSPAVFINAGNGIRPNWPTMQLASLLPNGRYAEIPRAGHNIWLSHEAELRNELRAALQSLTAG